MFLLLLPLLGLMVSLRSFESFALDVGEGGSARWKRLLPTVLIDMDQADFMVWWSSAVCRLCAVFVFLRLPLSDCLGEQPATDRPQSEGYIMRSTYHTTYNIHIISHILLSGP